MRRPRILAAAAVLALALAAAGAELALPSLAEDRVRDRLTTLGSVTSVDITATPALKLLLGEVESADIHLSSATVDSHTLTPELLDGMGGMEELDVRVDKLRAGPVDVDSLLLNKRGSALDASVTLDAAQVESLVPGSKLTVSDGALVLELADLPLPLPLPEPLRMEIGVDDGRVVARPLGAAAALMPVRPLLDRPELSVSRLRTTLADGQVHLRADATLSL